MKYRILIFKNNIWQELDLPSDFNLSLILNSGFLGKKQTGSFSFASTLPTTPNNCTILQNVQVPQIVADRNIQYPAKLLNGSTELYSWFFVLRGSNHKAYKYDLIQTPGNQTRNFFEKKLWQLDFGKLELESANKQANLWTIDLYGPSKLYEEFLKPTAIYFEIEINGVVVAKPIVGTQNDESLQYWYLESDPETRFNMVTKNVTTHFISLNIPKPGIASINVISNSNPIISVKIKLYNITITTFINRGTFIAQHNLSNLSFDDISEGLNAITMDIEQYPFRFITYFNDNYYPSDNAQYEGIVNMYAEEGKLYLNDGYTNQVTYAVSPNFSLKFIFEKLAAMMGFTLKAPIFQDKAASGDYFLGDVYLINNVDFSQQLTGTTIPFNVYGKVITFSEYMPDMTAKEFIDAVRTTFCLAIDYDYANSEMNVTMCKDVINSTEVIDISTKLTRFPESESSDKTYYQLSFKDGDTTIISQYEYPTEESIQDDGKDYTKIPLGFTPVVNNFDIDPFLTYNPHPGISTVSDSSRSSIYLEQKNNRPAQKICFALGGSNASSYTYIYSADNKNDKLCLSFQNQGNLKGLLAFYQDYLDFLNNTTQWSAEITLNELELANFKFAQKYYAYGTTFLVESLNPKLPVRDDTKVKLLSV